MVGKVRLAVVGIGRISTAHIHGILNSTNIAELTAVMSRNEERAKNAAEKFGAQKFYTKYEDVLADPTIDGVILCTPNNDHYWQSLAAARAGKHILVEKPMAMNVEEAVEMERAASEHGVNLMVAQCRRFFKAVQTAKTRIKEIGDVVDTTHFLGVHFDKALTDWWKEMEHLIIELNAPHSLDTTLYLLDETPASVYAVGGGFREKFRGTSQSTIVLTFPSGRTATTILSFHCNPPRNVRMIAGTKGTMRIEDEKDLWIGEDLVISEENGHYLDGGINFERQIQEFCLSIMEKREAFPSSKEIILLMQVLDAVKLSLNEKRIVLMEEVLLLDRKVK